MKRCMTKSKSQLSFFTCWTACSLLVFQACSTPAAKPATAPRVDSPPSESVSQVEIDYFLGHNQYKFTADGAAGKAEVTTYLEKSVVEHSSVDPGKYGKFLDHAVTFAEKPRREPSQETDCRSPFSVAIKIDAKSYTSKGCRSSDEGALSRLIRDGEFLLYSKK